MARRWLITGVSSGLGAALMKAVTVMGDRVTGTVRSLPRSYADQTDENTRLVIMDLCNQPSIECAVREAAEWMGGIDILVNNAGAGMFGPVEACSIDDFRQVMEINYFGLVAVTQAALPHLRAVCGTLINVASMSSFMATAGTAPYAAAKHAVLGVSEALREELAPFGVRVVTALPGGFRTRFWSDQDNIVRDGTEAIYGDQPAGQIRQQVRQHIGHELGDPAKLAQLLASVAGLDDPPFYLVAGADALQNVGAKHDMIAADLARCKIIAQATAFDR